MTTHQVCVFEETVRKEKAMRKQHPLGPSMLIPREPKASPFEQHPTFANSQLSVTFN
jgi:hypothetical protein